MPFSERQRLAVFVLHVLGNEQFVRVQVKWPRADGPFLQDVTPARAPSSGRGYVLIGFPSRTIRSNSKNDKGALFDNGAARCRTARISRTFL
jgi:hypothetical protein